MKQLKVRWKTELVFIAIQAVLYAAFLTLDFTGKNMILSNYIKFTIVILCFCYALFYQKSADKSILFCLRSALFLTVVSDLFILLLDYYLYGVLTFIIAQQLYQARIILIDIKEQGKCSRKLFITKLLHRIALQVLVAFVICVALLQLGVVVDALLMASVFYFVSILSNTILAGRAAVHQCRDRGTILFAIGLIFFLLCDINVGLFNIAGYVNLPEKVYHQVYAASSILMWTFYAPSQVLIALSAGAKNMK